jgi:hypothetical protein
LVYCADYHFSDIEPRCRACGKRRAEPSKGDVLYASDEALPCLRQNS